MFVWLLLGRIKKVNRKHENPEDAESEDFETEEDLEDSDDNVIKQEDQRRNLTGLVKRIHSSNCSNFLPFHN